MPRNRLTLLPGHESFSCLVQMTTLPARPPATLRTDPVRPRRPVSRQRWGLPAQTPTAAAGDSGPGRPQGAQVALRMIPDISSAPKARMVWVRIWPLAPTWSNAAAAVSSSGKSMIARLS
jgi:hypothetical protein